MFDLHRPDAEAVSLLEGSATTSHDGTVKSVVWVGEHTGVTAGEDGLVKYVKLQPICYFLILNLGLNLCLAGGGISALEA